VPVPTAGPPGPSESRGAVDRQIDDEVIVHEVAPYGPVDEILAVRKCRCVCQGGVEVGPDVGECAERRLEVVQVLDEVGLRVIDQPASGIAEGAKFVQGRGDARAFCENHIERGWDPVQRASDDVAMPGELGGQSVQRLDGGNDVVPLVVEDPDEGIQPGKQFANLVFMPGKGRSDVVDDVADLSEPAGIDDRRQ
jgi:hypothetical protein